jgi:hypothetical protein
MFDKAGIFEVRPRLAMLVQFRISYEISGQFMQVSTL